MESKPNGKSRDLSHLPQNVLDKGAKLAYKNALRHLNAAHLLAESRDYGNATSHLVLAAEEAMKATLLFAYRFHDQVPISDAAKMFHEVFHKHQPKQIPFMVLVILLNFLQKTFQYLQNDRSHFARNMPRLSSPSKSGKSLLERMEKELSRMNKSKNDGFYVDYRDGAWIAPNRQTKRAYMRLEETVSPYVEALKSVFAMTPKEIRDHKENLAKILADNQRLKDALSQSG